MEYAKLVEEHGSNVAAAAAIGVSEATIRRRLAKEQANDNFSVVRRSTFRRGDDDSVIGYWETECRDEKKAQEAREAALEALAAKLPRAAPVARPEQSTEQELATVYTLTDAHVGMLAWHREGGADWDLEIAERTIVGCFAEAIRSAPAAQTAIFNQLGDLLHYDSWKPETPTSGHLLDADGRLPKMVGVAVRILRQVIGLLLEKHERVHVILAEGNHDMASSVWLRVMFAALYEDEPRVTVDQSDLPYYCHVHGDTMMVFHHSHLKRAEQLRGFVAAQFAPEWGQTKKRYIHTGDKHHSFEKDELGAKVIQHPTLAARDAYAARHGWHSERYMNAITYHAKFGEVGRVSICPEMLPSA
ncbi:hypothetical protein WJS89_10655 [Sphingomicrobium sp. XHP0235]|uniref:hypothetical protein n=1 Tax=Sphingomicrobium aquimarinum TaxID=3133971 RepID=UPI0031FE822D